MSLVTAARGADGLDLHEVAAGTVQRGRDGGRHRDLLGRGIVGADGEIAAQLRARVAHEQLNRRGLEDIDQVAEREQRSAGRRVVRDVRDQSLAEAAGGDRGLGEHALDEQLLPAIVEVSFDREREMPPFPPSTRSRLHLL